MSNPALTAVLAANSVTHSTHASQTHGNDWLLWLALFLVCVAAAVAGWLLIADDCT